MSILVSFCLTLLILSVSNVDGQTTCIGTGRCSCRMSDGSGVIDVTSLAKRNGAAAFTDIYAADGNFYSYNPCVGFNEGSSCTGVAGCQISGDQSTQYTIGDVNSAAFTYDGTNAHLTYGHTDESGFQRKFDVTLQCDQSADPATFVASGESSPGSGQYAATLTTKCACPNACSGTPPPTPKPGPGEPGREKGNCELNTTSWLWISFSSLVFVYVLGGFIALGIVIKVSGREGESMSTFGRFGRRSNYEEM